MQHSARYICVIGMTLMIFPVNHATSQNMTGDVKLACEALLCLSSGLRPSECTASLRRYFRIWNKKPHKRIRARLNFLKLCPAAGQTPEMQALTTALANGAGSCSAENLNNSLRRSVRYGFTMQHYVINAIPPHCKAMLGHEYTDYTNSTMPVYVGEEQNGGYWVEAKDYEKALRGYERNYR